MFSDSMQYRVGDTLTNNRTGKTQTVKAIIRYTPHRVFVPALDPTVKEKARNKKNITFVGPCIDLVKLSGGGVWKANKLARRYS